jgi:hypothetical protein
MDTQFTGNSFFAFREVPRQVTDSITGHDIEAWKAERVDFVGAKHHAHILGITSAAITFDSVSPAAYVGCAIQRRSPKAPISSSSPRAIGSDRHTGGQSVIPHGPDRDLTVARVLLPARGPT